MRTGAKEILMDNLQTEPHPIAAPRYAPLPLSIRIQYWRGLCATQHLPDHCLRGHIAELASALRDALLELEQARLRYPSTRQPHP